MKNCSSFFIHQSFNASKFGESKNKISQKLYQKNKYLIPRFKEVNDPISKKYAAQILSFNLALTLLLLNFLIIGLCSSWTSSSFTLPSNSVFLSKKIIDQAC